MQRRTVIFYIMLNIIVATVVFAGIFNQDIYRITPVSDNMEDAEIGTLWFDGQRNTIAIRLGNGVTSYYGRGNQIYVTNKTTNKLNHGDVVGINGVQGVFTKIEKISTSSFNKFSIGIVSDKLGIEIDQRGYIQTSGIIQTDTSTLTPGSIAYLSTTSGVLTSIPSTPPNRLIIVGLCLTSNPNGLLLIAPWISPMTSEISDILITSPQDGDVLKYNGVEGYWYNDQP